MAMKLKPLLIAYYQSFPFPFKLELWLSITHTQKSASALSFLITLQNCINIC